MSDVAQLMAEIAVLKTNIESLTNTTKDLADAAAATDNTINQFWLMVCAILVFFMHTGFTMLECGTVRAKNISNIIFKNVANVCLSSVSFWAFGWALAYGGDYSLVPTNVFLGSGEVFLVSEVYDKGDVYASWFFQWAFAATGATIVSGAIAERCTVLAFCIFCVWMTGFVYPVVVHWVWSGAGWLSAFNGAGTQVGTSGMMDFAGSGVVHLSGGVAAFLAALVLGPRTGRFGPKEESAEERKFRDMQYRPHSRILQTCGVLILWVGWYGFNAGSTLALAGGAYQVSARVCVTTTLSAGMGGLSALAMGRVLMGHWDTEIFGNGVLGGLVSITANCSVVNPWAAVLIGLIGGVIYFGWAMLLLKLRIDDVLQASAVHGACGVWGCIALALFATEKNVGTAYGAGSNYGLFYGGGFEQLGVQLLGCFAIIVWVGITTGVLFVILKVTKIFRVDKDAEVLGLDETEHGGAGYDFGIPSARKNTVEVGQSKV